MDKNRNSHKIEGISTVYLKETHKKSIIKDDHSLTLPTMISYQNICNSYKGEKLPKVKSLKKNTKFILDENLTIPCENKQTSPKLYKKEKFTNKLKNYYSYINVNDDLETRKEKVLNTINYLSKDLRKGYFTEKKATGKKKDIDSLRLGKDKKNLFKDNIKNDPKKLAEVNEFLDNLNNPSMGIGFLKKKYPILYEKYHGIYETNIEKNFCKKNLKDILIAKKTANATHETLFKTVDTNNIAKVKKLKLKWKTIKWFLDNKKNNLERLFQKQDVISSKFKGDKGLNIKEFTNVLKDNGITNDQELINKLFWVFDEDGSGDIEYKELAFGLEMFRDSSFENKIKVFFDICDADNSGAISKLEFYSMLKKNLVNSKLRLIMKQVVDKIFHSSLLNSNGEMTFENLKASCSQNKLLNDLIMDNLEALKKIDDVIDNDFKAEFDKIDPNKNEEIRRKLNNINEIIIPVRDRKFENMLNEYISLKEDQINSRKLFNNNDELFNI